MFTCKQVSNALSKEDYEKLSPMRRFFLKLHVKLCVFCGRFNRQVMDSQDMCRCYREHEQDIESNRPKMDASKKDSLKELLAAQSSKES
ncbi:MAG TPA: hypothetical protein DCX06_14135 [Opitutae bacterium]|nr:hypothetical protein [Opitutae bacterium]